MIKASGSSIKNENISDHQIAEKLNKPIIKKLEKRKVHSPFIDNILGADLADMWLISKFDKGIRFYYVLLIFSLTTHGLFLWKTEKVLQLLMVFKEF